jgi:aminoglycoside N3'-acetyltransferase
MIEKIAIHKQLKSLNILPSDLVIINLNIEKFGLIENYKRMDYVTIFEDYFNSGGGTFISLAFTPAKFSICNKNLPFFDGHQSANTGAFANSMLKNSNAHRSMHPTNSVVAIGAKAKDFIYGLDEYSGAYEFARRAIDMDAKVLLIGMNDFPGFLTHLVEQDLKLYRKYWNRFFLKVRMKDKIFKRLDPGGCSKTFSRLYPEYIKKELLRVGMVNKAYSLSIDASKAYDVDYDIISKNPNILICDDKNCNQCRVFRWKTIFRLPFFTIKYIYKRLRNAT